MTLSDIFAREFTRIRVLLVVMMAALLFLCIFLWQLQVFNVRKYRGSVEKQSVRRVRLPGARGNILDRNGVALADNRPSYCIAVYIEELRQPGRWDRTIDKVEKVINELSEKLMIEKRVTRDDIKKHIKSRLYMPFLVWRDIDNSVIARWAESNIKFPGVDIYVEPVRVYPDGQLAAHVLGYVGKADPSQSEEESYHFYMPEMAGKWGIESGMNDTLAGVPGGRLICVDASGYKRRDKRLQAFEQGAKIGERLAHSGNDVVLTIDVGIQRLLEQSLTNATGAGVIMDPRNGDILAMASSPGFDPNRISEGLTKQEWDEIRTGEDNPMINRAISGIYPPGSIFKPVVVMAALENNKAGEGTYFHCPGYFQLGNVRFHCWSKEGHGSISLRKAIEQSCNAYFCQLGLLCGNELIHDMAAKFGFGQKTGIDLGMEMAGLLPDEPWKKRVLHDGWRKGDTCNLSIGQGALVVTPLQIVVYVSAIANGGNVYKPRIIKENDRDDGTLVRKMNWSKESLRILRNGMHDVIQADTGTGKRARIVDVEMAGKTGTAEYGPKAARKKNAWMIVFAPFDKPRYAIAMVIEEGISGGLTIAPRIREITQGIFTIEKSRKTMIESKQTGKAPEEHG